MEVPIRTAPEKSSEGDTIHFEPGIHPRTESEYTAIYEDFNRGNLEPKNMWNKEVGARIASYAYDAPALLLSIDGLEPQPPSAYPLFTPHQEAMYTWVSLPARP